MAMSWVNTDPGQPGLFEMSPLVHTSKGFLMLMPETRGRRPSRVSGELS